MNYADNISINFFADRIVSGNHLVIELFCLIRENISFAISMRSSFWYWNLWLNYWLFTNSFMFVFDRLGNYFSYSLNSVLCLFLFCHFNNFWLLLSFYSLNLDSLKSYFLFLWLFKMLPFFLNLISSNFLFNLFFFFWNLFWGLILPFLHSSRFIRLLWTFYLVFFAMKFRKNNLHKKWRSYSNRVH